MNKGTIDVSIIVAMYNIGDTLAETLESIRSQTHSSWEAVLVNDGSTDNTAEVASDFADRDPRFRVITQANAGVSVARNSGIKHARYDWLLFVDGDDWLLPRHLERMTAALRKDPALDGVYCGWCWVSPDGYYFHKDIGRHSGDLFHLHADQCPYAIHAYVVQRSVVETVGGFDPALRTCEDWDLWQRISRTGMRFGRVAAVLAPARMRATSASMDGRQILADGLKVLEQGHAPDPRVPISHPVFSHGLPAQNLVQKRYYLICSASGLLIGRGEDPSFLLDMAGDSACPQLDAYAVAECIALAAMLSASRPLRQWDQVWLDLEPLANAFLDALERRTGIPDLANRAGRLPPRLAQTYMEAIGGAYRLRGWLNRLALFPGRLKSGVMQCLWLGIRWSKCLVGNALKFTPGLHRRALRLYRRLRPAENMDYFEGLFEEQADPWRYTSAYEQTKYEQTLALIPAGTIETALELACAEGHFTVQLAPLVQSLLATDISETALERAAERCQGHHNVLYQQLDIIKQPIPGHYNLMVCSEVLYYAGSYAKLQKLARKMADALKPGGHLIMAHANVVIDAPEEVGFNWEHDFGAKGIGETFAALCELSFVKELRTPLYRIQLFRKRIASAQTADSKQPEIILEEHAKAIDPDVASQVLWQGSSDHLPILLYHSVAAGGSEALADYRVTPTAFEQQLRYLHDQGYRSISPNDCYSWFYEFAHIPRGALLITFDDGYVDFKEHAWPLLQHYGFSAHLFLVADLVGKSNQWDHHYGEVKPLMNWNQIRQLQSDGVTFGAHSLTHATLSSLGLKQITNELKKSQRIIEHELGEPIKTFAYPYGAFNKRVQYLTGICGYDLAMTCEPDLCTLAHSPLALPRVEIEGNDSLESFAKKLADLQSFPTKELA